MSWFSVPLPNPLKALQFSDDESEPEPEPESESQPPNNPSSSSSSGVKDDFSALGESIGRQLRGVAAFLAPSSPDQTSSKLAGIRSDLAEIGGTLKSSVSQISKLASDFLQLNDDDDLPHHHDHHTLSRDHGDGDGDGEDDEEEEEEYEGPGITDEVIQFAGKISDRAELWTDFPLSIQQEFDLSEAQSEHVSIIEQLVPSLADLRSRLVSEIDEKQFWVIYFILLLPRLTEDDLELLSTPEIIEARETLLQMLRSKNEPKTNNSENPQASDDSSNVVNKVEEVQQKATVSETESSTASRSRESNESVSDAPGKIIEDTDNQKDSQVPKPSSAALQLQSEDDVSFSDLEDDDDDTDVPNRAAESTRASSPEGSNEWVRLNKGAGIGRRGSQSRGQLSSRDRESEGEESSGWLTVDEFDP